ncbi:MAG: MAPEG family protein [Marinagarivorans sp.]|nr:MAPEG family protein [Marinagarivorans sp.]
MIYPMFAMVVLTLIVGCTAFYVRVKSVKNGQLKPRDFALMNAEKNPESVIKTTRNFNNQFEVPVLFYVACLAFLATNITSPLGEILAWAFVGCRIAHAFIHITYNHLLHRVIAFWLAVFVVLAQWIVLLLSLGVR